jgi:hypothetical protein
MEGGEEGQQQYEDDEQQNEEEMMQQQQYEMEGDGGDEDYGQEIPGGAGQQY